MLMEGTQPSSYLRVTNAGRKRSEHKGQPRTSSPDHPASVQRPAKQICFVVASRRVVGNSPHLEYSSKLCPKDIRLGGRSSLESDTVQSPQCRENNRQVSQPHSPSSLVLPPGRAFLARRLPLADASRSSWRPRSSQVCSIALRRLTFGGF